MSTSETAATSVDKSRSRVELVLEAIALRHQIAVLKRCGTRRPCFRGWDRLFWILLSWWWPRWREALMIVQPETVLRWRRNDWSGLWQYRSRGRWRGGRPRISRGVRGLILRIARENFLWGATRIHSEMLMLGFEVYQATVSRYIPKPDRRPRQS
jgi:putative transposase